MADVSSMTHWIDTPSALDAVCQHLEKSRVIALDTEFKRETTFNAIPALIQLSDGVSVWFIDPVAIAATPAFQQLMQSSDTLKLIHACSEDLEVLAQWGGCVPAPLMDTQIAESLLGPIPAMGYQKLVEKYLAIPLDKGATRSDWLKRPLSSTQYEYAALDVLYLPAIWALQKEALEEKGRLSWVFEDCQRLIESAEAPSDYSQYYLRHRNAWKLSKRALGVFAALCEWRETQVRERDIPRNWLVSDAVLFEMAEKMPRDKAGLAVIKELKRSVLKQDGNRILAIISQALKDKPDVVTLISPVTPFYRQAQKVLKGKVKQQAELLDIAPEVLVRRRDYDDWITVAAHDSQKLDECSLGGWRGDLLDATFRKSLDTPSVS